MARLEDVLNSTLAAMQAPSMRAAHVRHVPAISRLVRLHASTGFALHEVGRVAAIINAAAEYLDHGVSEYAQVLPALCTLCAIPFSRGSMSEDHVYLHEVSELLSALGSLLNNRVDHVAQAAAESLLNFALARTPHVTGEVKPTATPPRGSPVALSRHRMSHRAAVNHAGLERSTVVCAAAEALELAADSGGGAGGDGGGADGGGGCDLGREDADREGAEGAAARRGGFGSRRAPSRRADARNLPLLRCIAEFTRASASARQLAESDALGNRLLPLLAESARDSRALPPIVETLLNIVESAEPLIGAAAIHDGGGIGALNALLRELLRSGTSAHDGALRDDVLGVLVALARVPCAPLRADLCREDGVLAALCECLASETLSLGSNYERAFNLDAPAVAELARALLALALALDEELRALPAGCALTHHLGAALVELARVVPPNSAPVATVGGASNASAHLLAEHAGRRALARAQRHELRVGALGALAARLGECVSTFVQCGGPETLIAALRCDGEPHAREAVEGAHAALGALDSAIGNEKARAWFDLGAIASELCAALELAEVSAKPPSALVALSPSASASRFTSSSAFSGSRDDDRARASTAVGSDARGARAAELADSWNARVRARGVFNDDAPSYPLAGLDSQRALLEVLARACATDARAAGALAARGGGALLARMLRAATELGAQTELVCALVECVSAVAERAPAHAHELVRAGALDALLSLIARAPRALRAQQLSCAAVLVEASGAEGAGLLLRWYAPPALAALRPARDGHMQRAARVTIGDGGSESALAMFVRLWLLDEKILGVVRIHGGVVFELADPLASVPLGGDEAARALEREAVARRAVARAAEAAARATETSVAEAEGPARAALAEAVDTAHARGGVARSSAPSGAGGNLHDDGDGGGGGDDDGDGDGGDGGGDGDGGDDDGGGDSDGGDDDVGDQISVGASRSALSAQASYIDPADDDDVANGADEMDEEDEDEEVSGWPPTRPKAPKRAPTAAAGARRVSPTHSAAGRAPAGAWSRPVSRKGGRPPFRGVGPAANGDDAADSELDAAGAPAADGALSQMGVRAAIEFPLSALGLGAEREPPPGEPARRALQTAAQDTDLRVQLAALVATARSVAPVAYADAASALTAQGRISLEAIEAFATFAESRERALVARVLDAEGLRLVEADLLERRARGAAALEHARAVRARQLDQLGRVVDGVEALEADKLTLMRRTRDGLEAVPLTRRARPVYRKTMAAKARMKELRGLVGYTGACASLYGVTSLDELNGKPKVPAISFGIGGGSGGDDDDGADARAGGVDADSAQRPLGETRAPREWADGAPAVARQRPTSGGRRPEAV
ncbi:hypothetical protein KFE25_007644 [Diacronema lutheri]|uniref:Cilia- and flagella-associated protein 69 ARM repeats domain-containing protein n=1 Tax=Diacronema lutheri TaxID=2081491 RepID=A0A8J5XUB6_DIALT|nr:hypothetical protein KFE25_007644 [Diacronema lutheri]